MEGMDLLQSAVDTLHRHADGLTTEVMNIGGRTDRDRVEELDLHLHLQGGDPFEYDGELDRLGRDPFRYVGDPEELDRLDDARKDDYWRIADLVWLIRELNSVASYLETLM